MDNKIGERIKKARKRAGFTQEALAEKLGIAYPTLNKYEKSHRTPDSALLSRMVTILDCDAGWLLTGEGSVDSHDMGIDKQIASESIAEYEASMPRLAALIEKLVSIYNDGDLDEKSRMMGTIEALHDEIQKKKEEVGKVGEAEKKIDYNRLAGVKTTAEIEAERKAKPESA